MTRPSYLKEWLLVIAILVVFRLLTLNSTPLPSPSAGAPSQPSFATSTASTSSAPLPRSSSFSPTPIPKKKNRTARSEAATAPSSHLPIPADDSNRQSLQTSRSASDDEPVTDELPTSASHAGDYFTLNSTKDDVLAVQGTPTEFSDAVWSYGLSKVYFNEKGRVVSWMVSASDPLKVR